MLNSIRSVGFPGAIGQCKVAMLGRPAAIGTNYALGLGMRSKNRAFTLVEIMIVVLIIGILLAIAVPSFMHARSNAQTNSCVQNLWQIEQAKEQFAMANNLASGAAIGNTQIVPGYIKT